MTELLLVLTGRADHYRLMISDYRITEFSTNRKCSGSRIPTVAQYGNLYFAFDSNWLFEESFELRFCIFADPDRMWTTIEYPRCEWSIKNAACTPGVDEKCSRNATDFDRIVKGFCFCKIILIYCYHIILSSNIVRFIVLMTVGSLPNLQVVDLHPLCSLIYSLGFAAFDSFSMANFFNGVVACFAFCCAFTSMIWKSVSADVWTKERWAYLWKMLESHLFDDR